MKYSIFHKKHALLAKVQTLNILVFFHCATNASADWQDMKRLLTSKSFHNNICMFIDANLCIPRLSQIWGFNAWFLAFLAVDLPTDSR